MCPQPVKMMMQGLCIYIHKSSWNYFTINKIWILCTNPLIAMHLRSIFYLMHNHVRGWKYSFRFSFIYLCSRIFVFLYFTFGKAWKDCSTGMHFLDKQTHTRPKCTYMAAPDDSVLWHFTIFYSALECAAK